MPLAYCQRCEKQISKPRSGVCPICGSPLATYYRPGEVVGTPRKKTGRDIGQAIGSLLTSGSSIGVAVGHTIGKVLEGRVDFLKDAISFTPLPPEPEGQIDLQIVQKTLERVDRVLDALFTPESERKKAIKPRKSRRPRSR